MAAKTATNIRTKEPTALAVGVCQFVVNNISKIVAASTGLVVFGEGIDIMLRRLRDSLRKEKEMKAQVRAQAKAEVYEEVAAWDRRRKEAENRGEEFTEPPPTQPQEKSKE